MAILKCKRKKTSLYVAFGSDTSIRYAARIKSALTRIIAEQANIYRLDLSEIEDTDITFIQLLMAFNEKLKKQNRKMILINLPEESQFVTTAIESGINLQTLFEIEDG